MTKSRRTLPLGLIGKPRPCTTCGALIQFMRTLDRLAPVNARSGAPHHCARETGDEGRRQRRRAHRRSYTKAGPVKITRANGSVETRPAYNARSLRTIVAEDPLRH